MKKPLTIFLSLACGATIIGAPFSASAYTYIYDGAKPSVEVQWDQLNKPASPASASTQQEAPPLPVPEGSLNPLPLTSVVQTPLVTAPEQHAPQKKLSKPFFTALSTPEEQPQPIITPVAPEQPPASVESITKSLQKSVIPPTPQARPEPTEEKVKDITADTLQKVAAEPKVMDTAPDNTIQATVSAPSAPEPVAPAKAPEEKTEHAQTKTINVSPPNNPTPAVVAPPAPAIAAQQNAPVEPAKSNTIDAPLPNSAAAVAASTPAPTAAAETKAQIEPAKPNTIDAPLPMNTAPTVTPTPAPAVVAEAKAPEEKVTELATPRAIPPTDPSADPKAPAASAKPDLTFEFAAGAYQMTPPLQAKLDDLIKQLQATPDLRLQIIAYAQSTDDGPSSARRLSLARGLLVRSYLTDKGIKPTRLDIRALGAGTDHPPVDRVDIVFLK